MSDTEPPPVREDARTYIWRACDCLRRFGVCTEEAWPFDMTKLFGPPILHAMREAYLHKISAYCGHATYLIGRDEHTSLFIGENSWGDQWGDHGYYWLAPEVIADSHSTDFWVITGSRENA